jgi:hypothetical protein
MQAPWINRIFIVTANQRPQWVADEGSHLSFIDHSAIAENHFLPSFNSSAITTWIHRIPNLSEHFIFLNDDFFIGKPVRPSHFFTAGGIPRVQFSQNTRPVAQQYDLAHFFDQMKANQRELLRSFLGREIVRFVKHVPQPLRLHTLKEIEQAFASRTHSTRAARFRSTMDINVDQFHHYYALATGRAVEVSHSYTYIDVGRSESLEDLNALLCANKKTFFCLNDGRYDGDVGLQDDVVQNVLASLFPISAPWEKLDPL